LIFSIIVSILYHIELSILIQFVEEITHMMHLNMM